MSVRKRILSSGEARWLCDYRDRGGKRRAKQFRTKREADAYEIKVGGEIERGVHVADSASVTIERAGEFWLQRARIEGLEASTSKQYREHLKLHIAPSLGSMKLSRLTKPAVEKFRDQLLETKSRALTRKILVSLRSIISEAQRRGLIAQNCASGTRVAAQTRHEERLAIPSKKEIKALADATAAMWPSTEPWRALVLVALFTGLRASELRGLTWDNVDLEKKLIKVRQRCDFQNKLGSCKSKAGVRDVALPPMALNALRQWKLACPRSDFVFSTRNGTPILNSNMHRQCWKPLLKKAVVSGYRFHDLRHVAASMYIEAGWSPKKIMTVMGHSSIKITYDLYGHLWASHEDDAEAAALIEKRFFA